MVDAEFRGDATQVFVLPLELKRRGSPDHPQLWRFREQTEKIGFTQLKTGGVVWFSNKPLPVEPKSLRKERGLQLRRRTEALGLLLGADAHEITADHVAAA
jgi:hypothetical protein